MPTYDYKCNSCSHTFEIFQSIKDDPLKECPNCRGELKRLIGIGVQPIFKGSGFYQTDYKNNSNNKSSVTKKEEKNVKPDKSDKSDKKSN